MNPCPYWWLGSMPYSPVSIGCPAGATLGADGPRVHSRQDGERTRSYRYPSDIECDHGPAVAPPSGVASRREYPHSSIASRHVQVLKSLIVWTSLFCFRVGGSC